MVAGSNNNPNGPSGRDAPDDGTDASNDDSYYDRMNDKPPTDMGPYPYDEYLFRKEVYAGTQVYDCGNCLYLAGNKNEPVNKAQVKAMIHAAIHKKNYAVIYMFDKSGKAIPDYGRQVDDVIQEMRRNGELPPGCLIRAATTGAEYPKDTAAKFERWLRTQWLSGAFNAQAQADVAREMGQSGPGYDHSQGQTKAAAPAPAPA